MAKKDSQPLDQAFIVRELLHYYHGFEYSRSYQLATLRVWRLNADDGKSPYCGAYREALRQLAA